MVTAESHDDRWAAERAEHAAIDNEAPLYNVALSRWPALVEWGPGVNLRHLPDDIDKDARHDWLVTYHQIGRRMKDRWPFRASDIDDAMAGAYRISLTAAAQSGYGVEHLTMWRSELRRAFPLWGSPAPGPLASRPRFAAGAVP